MELVNYCFDTRYADIMSSHSGLYPREAFHRPASPQTFFGVRSSRIHFSPMDGFSYERVAQFNLERIFSKLDSGFQSLVGFRIPRAKNSWIPESGFLTWGDQLVEHCSANAEAMDSNPAEVPTFFFGLICNCLNCNYQFDDQIFI